MGLTAIRSGCSTRPCTRGSEARETAATGRAYVASSSRGLVHCVVSSFLGFFPRAGEVLTYARMASSSLSGTLSCRRSSRTGRTATVSCGGRGVHYFGVGQGVAVQIVAAVGCDAALAPC